MARGRRPRSSWGSIDQRERNVWRIRYCADTGDGKGYRRHAETFEGSRTQAERRLAELRTMYDGGEAHRRVPTFDELWARDVSREVEKLAPNTRHAYGAAWKVVSERWGSTKLDAYNGAEVQDWLQGIPKRTGRACLTLMRKVSNRALLLGVVRYDPLAAEIKVSDFSRRKPERTELELAPYFEAAMDGGPMMLAGVILMAAGGCRFGEALAVRADSVRWDDAACRALFDVSDQVDTRTTALAGRLKNKQSARTASVPGTLGMFLVELSRRALSEGCTFVVDDGMGKPIGEAAFRSRWKGILKKRGLENVTMRSLRRSFATIALDAGASAGDVNLAMGHTRDSRTLFTNYDRPNAKKAPVLPDAWVHIGTFDA